MVRPESEPRAAALAEFLRDQARALSLSAEATDAQHTARAGMALLDAALLAEALSSGSAIIVRLSEAGRFESLPQNRARFVATAEIHRVLRRPISGSAQDAAAILDAIVSASSQL